MTTVLNWRNSLYATRCFFAELSGRYPLQSLGSGKRRLVYRTESN
jgi:hypothetical protein